MFKRQACLQGKHAMFTISPVKKLPYHLSDAFVSLLHLASLPLDNIIVSLKTDSLCKSNK